jgi:hypothetical protein
MTQLADAVHKGVVRYVNVSPYRLKQLLLAHQPPRSCDKVGDYIECFGSQLDKLAAPEQATAIQINRKAVERPNPSHDLAHPHDLTYVFAARSSDFRQKIGISPSFYQDARPVLLLVILQPSLASSRPRRLLAR